MEIFTSFAFIEIFQTLYFPVSLTKSVCSSWLKATPLAKLKPFAGLIHNYLESCWIVIRSLVYLKKKPLTQKEWLVKIRPLGDRMFRKGEILRAEALSQANYQNAIKFIEGAEIISSQAKEEKGGKREVTFSLTDNRAQLEVLRRRLFKFL